MSAEIVNLRRVRKAKLRVAKAADAATNRALHGRSRVERETVTLTRQREERRLDGHLREAGGSGDAPGVKDDGDVD